MRSTPCSGPTRGTCRVSRVAGLGPGDRGGPGAARGDRHRRPPAPRQRAVLARSTGRDLLQLGPPRAASAASGSETSAARGGRRVVHEGDRPQAASGSPPQRRPPSPACGPRSAPPPGRPSRAHDVRAGAAADPEPRRRRALRQSPDRWERIAAACSSAAKNVVLELRRRTRSSAYTVADRAEQQQRLVDQVAAEVAQRCRRRRRRHRVGRTALERATRTAATSPSSPSASSRRTVSRSESQRRFW